MNYSEKWELPFRKSFISDLESGKGNGSKVQLVWIQGTIKRIDDAKEILVLEDSTGSVNVTLSEEIVRVDCLKTGKYCMVVGEVKDFAESIKPMKIAVLDDDIHQQVWQMEVTHQKAYLNT